MIVTANRIWTLLLGSVGVLAVGGVAWRLHDPPSSPPVLRIEPFSIAVEPIVERVERGLAVWQGSCPSAVDGLCVIERALAPAPKGELPLRCGPESIARVEPQPRASDRVAFARAELRAAIETYEQRDDHDAATRHAIGEARLALADHDFEHYLSIQIPTDLDFSPDKPDVAALSTQRFNGWAQTKARLERELRTAYAGVASLGDPVTEVAARARIGTIAQSFADSLWTSPIPKSLRTSEFAADVVDAFCDRMTVVAEPLTLP